MRKNNRRVPNLVLLFSVLIIASPSNGLVSTPITKIAGMSFYSEWGSGTVHFEVESPVTGCEGGFWLDTTLVGFEATYSALLAAYHANQNVTVSGQETEVRAGLGGAGPYCKLYFFSYE